MTQILIYKNKYGEDFYDASTPQKLEAASRKILKGLLDSRWIPQPPDEPDFRYSNIDMELANLTNDQINELPVISLRTEALRHKEKLANKIKGHVAEVAEYAEWLAVANGEEIYAPDWVRRADSMDGTQKKGDVVKGGRVTAWSILRHYEDEYVSFELEDLIEVEA